MGMSLYSLGEFHEFTPVSMFRDEVWVIRCHFLGNFYEVIIRQTRLAVMTSMFGESVSAEDQPCNQTAAEIPQCSSPSRRKLTFLQLMLCDGAQCSRKNGN